MARMRLTDFDTFGTTGYITAVSWQFAKDPDFIYIIDESLKDTVNLEEWVSPLPKRSEDIAEGETYPYYSDETKIYGRMKAWIDNTESDWYIVEYQPQTVQKVYVIHENEVAEDVQKEYWTTSKKLGWTDLDDSDPNILTPKVETE